MRRSNRCNGGEWLVWACLEGGERSSHDQVHSTETSHQQRSAHMTGCAADARSTKLQTVSAPSGALAPVYAKRRGRQSTAETELMKMVVTVVVVVVLVMAVW